MTTVTAPADVKPLEIAEHGDVAVVTINRPARRNALTSETRVRMTTLLSDLADGEAAPAVVLASRASAFSAGQDLGEAREFQPEEIGSWIEEHMALYRAILSYPRPLLAAVDGCCVGAGFQIALLCDLRLATPESFFAMPELEDAIPCILGVWTLWDVIGRSRTTEMVLTNRRVPAEEAHEWGLVNGVVRREQLLDETIELADRLALKPGLAFRLTKERLALLALEASESLSVHAAYAHTLAFASGEPERAMTEFLTKGRSAS